MKVYYYFDKGFWLLPSIICWHLCQDEAPYATTGSIVNIQWWGIFIGFTTSLVLPPFSLGGWGPRYNFKHKHWKWLPRLETLVKYTDDKHL